MTDEERTWIEDIKERNARKQHVIDFALTLLEQCKGENLTMNELDYVLKIIKSHSMEVTLRDGLVL